MLSAQQLVISMFEEDYIVNALLLFQRMQLERNLQRPNSDSTTLKLKS